MRKLVYSLVIVIVVSALGYGGGYLLSARPPSGGPRIETTTGGSGASWTEPIVRSPGSYSSDVFRVEAVNRATAAEAVESAKPKFTGPIHGLVVATETGDIPLVRCERTQMVSGVEALGSAAIPLPRYLPPGAIERREQFGARCGSAMLFSERRFELSPTGAQVYIVRWPSRRVLRAHTSLDRISTGTVGRFPAVIVRPIVPEGYGNGYVAVLDSATGMTQVAGIHVRLDDLLKIAEGLQ